ncbi:MAG: protein kinase domain-containing protein [Planctomycetota bacterium]
MDKSAVLRGFYKLYQADRERGEVRPLEAYQDLFSEHGELIAAEFAKLSGEQAPPPEEEQPSGPDKLGHYTIDSKLGHGGQGQVFLATDSRLERKVALKVLGPSFDFSYVERFKREAAAASRLDHPGICPVYDAGEADGTQYIAMRYVDGESLADLLARARGPEASSDTSSLGPSTRPQIETTLQIIERAARALHTAHEAGLIHRDIKPGNIMVDSEGRPVILDFGLARDETGSLQSLTIEGDLLGTPAYMSPEQLMAQRIKLDRRTDIYSLGVTLFECLTLARPFEAPTRDALYKEILTGQLPDPTRINRTLSRELKIVLETACEKDRDRRYQTALDFAEDLKRVRTFQPIQARPLGPLLRFKRWTQRHPALATAVFALFLLLATGLAVALGMLQQVHAREAETRAALGFARALALAGESEEVVSADPVLGLLLAREAVAAEENPRTRSALYASLAAVNQVAEIRAGDRRRVGARVLQADRILFWSTGETTVRLCDFEGRMIARYETGHPVDQAYLSPDGERFVTRGTGNDQLYLWRVGKREPVHLAGHGAGTYFVYFSPDGDRISTHKYRQGYRVWNRDGKLLLDSSGTSYSRTRDWGRTATCDLEKKIVGLWDRDGKKLGEFDGDRCYVSSTGERFLIWTTGTPKFRVVDGDGKELAVVEPTGAYRGYATWTPGGSAFYTSTTEGDATTYWLYDRDGNLVKSFPSGTLTGFRMPYGRLFLTNREGDNTVLDEAGNEIMTTSGTKAGTAAQPGADPNAQNAFMTRASDGRALRLFDRDGRDLATIEVGVRNARIYTSSAWDRFITVTGGGDARLWDRTGKMLAQLGNGTVRFVSREKRIVVTGSDNTLRIFDWDGLEIGSVQGHDARFWFVGFSSDGHRLVTASHDGTARIWDLTQSPVPTLRGHRHPVREAAFPHRGRMVVTRSDGGTDARADRGRVGRARIYDNSGRPTAVLQHDDLPARVADDKEAGDRPQVPSSMSISPAGDRILTVSEPSLTCRLWDANGRKISDFEQSAVYAAEFLADGRILTHLRLRDDPRLLGGAVWDRDGRRSSKLGEWLFRPGPHFRPRVAPAGDRFLTMSGKPGQARLLGREGRVIATLDHPGSMARHGYTPYPEAWFTADGSRVALVTSEGPSYFVTLFDRDGKRIGEPLRYEEEIRLHMTPAAERVLIERVEAHTLEILDQGGRRIATLQADESIDSVTLPPRAERIFALSPAAGNARVWDYDGKEIGVVTSVPSVPKKVVYSPAGDKILAVLDMPMVPVYDLDGRTLTVLRGHTRAVTDVAVSPDGRWIVTGSKDGTARVWDFDGNLLQVLRGHAGVVETVTVSADGATILTTSADTTSRLWPSQFARVREFADAAAFRGFTESERARYTDLLEAR